MRALPCLALVAFTGLLFTLAGCSADASDDDAKASGKKSGRSHTSSTSEDESTEGESTAKGAKPKLDAYKEAVTIQVHNDKNDFCSGVLIAPTVVLTAAHCIVFNPGGTWTIKAPQIAGEPIRTAGAGEPMDAAFASLSYDDYANHPELHDLGLLYLDSAFDGISAYPTIKKVLASESTASVASKVTAIGRQAVRADSGLELSDALPLTHATEEDGYSAYKTPRISNGGDSGGPLFLYGTHTLLATEALFDPAKNVDYWARLDGEVYSWLDTQVSAHGGWK